jgi:capsular exopolysaccharide synthesis family protein
MDFLNQLTYEYLSRNLEKKNEFALNTIRFIDSQLDTISKSLNIAEKALEDFRSDNKVMDLSFQAQQVFEQLQELENQKMELDMQKKYYGYILDYIEENQDVESILAPSAMGVQDPLLNQLILEINQLSVQKSSLTNIKKGADFAKIRQLDAQIRNAKDNIYENATNLVKSTELTLAEVQKRINKLSVSINNLPETERQLFGIQRKFQLNDNLYTFLLQRRAEAQIAKASNTPDNEIIDLAMVSNNGYPIKPKTMINYVIALLLGLALPSVTIALKEYFNMRIDSPDMVKRITNKPIIGFIPNSGAEAESNIFADLDSPWAEAFRIVRTKLQFFLKEKQNPVVMVTSSIPTEGKSFVAINLASAYALTGKKTVLVGYDLRHPQLAQRFKLDKNIGVTNYLINENTLEEIVQKTPDPNLDLIASGTIPPNPAELIADKKTMELLTELKKRYDYIILDTAPISPVSDSHHLSRIADSTLFVIRDHITHKQALQNSMEELNNEQVENLCLVMNDIKLARKRYGSKYGYSYGYRYGYKYGYGYGYGYYREKGKKKKKKKK